MSHGKGDMVRTILHVDLDAFFCSVEVLLKPELRGKAFAVGGSPEGRGVISSASYEARKYGVRSAMPTARAMRLCPDLIVVSGRHEVYGEHSRKVMDLLREAAPYFEQLSIDEAFLDVSDDPRSGEEVASTLQTEIRERFCLPTSWGVASNKLVAKIATEVGKPDGLIVVPPGGERAFLAPLPVQMLWGVGPKTQARLGEEGVQRIGELAALSRDTLLDLLGEHGPDLAAKARGEDDRPVGGMREPVSMSAERTFPRDLTDRKELHRVILRLSDQVAYRLRKSSLVGRTVRVKIRWSDFSTITRQTKLSQPTDQDREIEGAARELFDAAWSKGRPVRLLGVGVSDLGKPMRQLDLFDTSWQHDDRLLKAIDAIRARYGRNALRKAMSLRPSDRTRDHGSDEDEGR
jgi:DNA polymerase-4